MFTRTLFGLLLGGVPLVAQEETGRWYALEPEVELSSLLEVCAQALDVPLHFDPSVVAGTVAIRSPGGLTDEGLWDLANRVLASQGLACVQAPGEGALGVVALEQAAELARLEEVDLTDARAGYVKVLLAVHQAQPEAIAEVLRNVLSHEGSLVQAIPESGRVLVAGLRPQVSQALSVVSALDAAPLETVIEEVSLRNLSATTVVSLLERIQAAVEKVSAEPPRGTLLANASSGGIVVVAPESELPHWLETVRRFDQAEEIRTASYVPRRFGLVETARLVEEVVRRPEAPWKLVEDELTGSLIVTATPSQHTEIEDLLRRIESIEAVPRQVMRAFPVKNRDVEELLGLLRDLLEAGGVTATGGGEAEEGVDGGTGDPVVRTGTSEVTLTKDEGTNRVLAVGPPRVLDEVAGLIESIDVRHPQVLVEAMIVSLTDSQSRDLAVELQKLATSGRTRVRLASLFGLGAADPGGSLGGAAGSGLEGVVLDPGSFSGVLRALEVLNRGRTLTVPKVLVNNNQTANLDSVLQTPFTSVNASNTVSTTSFGGTLDAGTVISITPQITEADRLLVEYSVSVSSFVGDSSDPALPPPRQENKIASRVTVPDGYAVILGGLEVASSVEARSLVPLLGRIPLLGRLFESRSTTDSTTRFFAFIRCSVLRHPRFEDLRYASARDLANAGVPDGRPVTRPRIFR